MDARLTRRGRYAVIAGAGILAVGAGAGLAAITEKVDSEPIPTAGTASPVAGPSQAGSSAAVPSAPAPARSSTASPTAAPAARGTSKWRVPAAQQALAGEIAGYARPFIAPGDPLELHVSSTSRKFEVVAYRIGDYDGKGATRVGRWGPFRGQVGAPALPDPDTGAITADWDVTTTLDTTGWEPGLYLVGLWTTGDSPRRYTIPVLVTSPDSTDRVVLVVGDTTWQAYNTWGGKSAYQGPDGQLGTRSRAVSFARPYNWSGYRWPAAFDIPLIREAESAGVPLAYASVTSITADPQSVHGALGIVSAGHDEYWTPKYRKALVKARDTGTNLAFMGANAGYWKTRMLDDWTAWMPKEGDDQRWRDDPEALAENAVTGQVYDCYPARADMVIRDPKFFLFRGTGVAKGTRISNLVGAETDRVYPLDGTPRPIEIPALSRAYCNDKAPTWSTMSYYTTPSGAGVFATGTMDWVRAMGGPRGDQGLGDDALVFTRKVTDNLLQAMAAGPMGKTHPATDALDEVDLPAGNTTGVTLSALR